MGKAQLWHPLTDRELFPCSFSVSSNHLLLALTSCYLGQTCLFGSSLRGAMKFFTRMIRKFIISLLIFPLDNLYAWIRSCSHLGLNNHFSSIFQIKTIFLCLFQNLISVLSDNETLCLSPSLTYKIPFEIPNQMWKIQMLKTFKQQNILKSANLFNQKICFDIIFY